MSFDMTPCGHLRRNLKDERIYCDKCRPGVPALEKQAELITADIHRINEQWFNRGFSPGVVSGVLLGASTAISQATGVTREEYLKHFNDIWPEEGQAHLPAHQPQDKP